MRQIFTPEEVREWTDEDFQKLVGKYIIAEIPASKWYKEFVPDGGEWEGGAGLCTEAGIKPSWDDKNDPPIIRYVMWDWGSGWSWYPNAEAYISICDEHGGHRLIYNHEEQKYKDNGDTGAAECLSTLGVRGLPTKNEVVESGEAETPQD